MDSNLYKEIIEDIFVPFAAEKYDFNCNIHQDNDPKHSSRLCSDALKFHNINWVKI